LLKLAVKGASWLAAVGLILSSQLPLLARETC
jgi:hypothetical protein